MTDVDKEYLDQFAEKYYLDGSIDDIDIEDTMQIYSFEKIKEQIGDSKKILDMGVGTGNFLSMLTENFNDISVVEGSDKLIDKFQKIHPSVDFINSLFEEFKPKEKYDCILALHVFEHVEDPEILSEIVSDWLTEDGKLIVVVPNKQSFHRHLGVTMGLHKELDDLSERDKIVGHLRVYDFRTLEKVFKEQFKVSNKFGYFLKTVPNSLMKNYPNDVIIGLTKLSLKLDPEYMGNIGLVLTKKITV
jgi:2-polyprenyl-3-methyl-5-hydroxy-6-metoxy-1,4-benzoquinol methylase